MARLHARAPSIPVNIRANGASSSSRASTSSTTAPMSTSKSGRWARCTFTIRPLVGFASARAAPARRARPARRDEGTPERLRGAANANGRVAGRDPALMRKLFSEAPSTSIRRRASAWSGLSASATRVAQLHAPAATGGETVERSAADRADVSSGRCSRDADLAAMPHRKRRPAALAVIPGGRGDAAGRRRAGGLPCANCCAAACSIEAGSRRAREQQERASCSSRSRSARRRKRRRLGSS